MALHLRTVGDMVVRKIIEIDEEKCDGCGKCVVACAEGALEIVDGKAKVVNEVFCDGLGACIGDCPQDALRIVEREAAGFDEEAVERHLEGRGERNACGCPSSAPMTIDRQGPAGDPGREPARPELANWPVQWRLVQPSSPFYKGADMMLAADCVPFAYAGFHSGFLMGRPLVIGCPKLDEQGEFLDKLTRLFREAEPRSVTVVMMEVPCCSGLVRLAEQAAKASGRDIGLERVVVGIDGRLQG